MLFLITPHSTGSGTITSCLFWKYMFTNLILHLCQSSCFCRCQMYMFCVFYVTSGGIYKRYSYVFDSRSCSTGGYRYSKWTVPYLARIRHYCRLFPYPIVGYFSYFLVFFQRFPGIFTFYNVCVLVNYTKDGMVEFMGRDFQNDYLICNI